MADHSSDNTISRRSFMSGAAQGAALAGAGGLLGFLAVRAQADDYVWQIDPDLCVNADERSDVPFCDRCATNCVLAPSAVKVVHAFAACGYCRLCTGFFPLDAPELNEAAENQLCPTNAIERTYIEDPYYEYKINETLCIGCGKCAKGCSGYGNGSLYLQIRHDVCVNCNQCSIALKCPREAIRRVPAADPYIPKFITESSDGEKESTS